MAIAHSARTAIAADLWRRRRRLGAIPALLVPEGIPLLRSGTEAAIRRLFGPPLDPQRDPGDHGLYGPGSATWALFSDPCVIVTGINALMIQTLHPRAMAGVVDHGSFQRDLMGRLHRTAAYVQAVNCGSMPEVFAASHRARRAHTTVVGHTPDGQAYSAEEPRLLAWVSIGLTLSVLSVWDLLGPHPVDRDTADAYVAEQAVAAALLDRRVDLRALAADPVQVAALQAGTADLPMLREGRLPRDRAQLDAMVADFARNELAMRQQARDAMGFLLDPPLDGVGLVGWKAVATASLAALPTSLRDIADVGGDPVRDAVRIAVVRAAIDSLRLVHGRTSTIRRATQRVRALPGAPPGDV